jgi:hypothetical protein
MANIIFDLDGTVIDTSHRYRNKPCGDIDLDFWFENSIPEKIAQDSLLPLADSWKRFYNEGHTIIVCTARSWDRHPNLPIDLGPIYESFLHDNGLHYHALLYRNLAGPRHENLGDGDLKIRLLTDYALSQGYKSIADMGAIMFDDNIKVIQAMIGERLVCCDATSYNRQLAKGKTIGKSIFDLANKWRLAS